MDLKVYITQILSMIYIVKTPLPFLCIAMWQMCCIFSRMLSILSSLYSCSYFITFWLYCHFHAQKIPLFQACCKKICY
ncbi:hypothetical protein RIR_jg5973.t1 [Rhizophagus irregularis DAOM 181602=DAOM 197198]|nr:hypothetical protein RhiirB3_187952 [Rhizophagus irregularis]GET57473.1 hypothetical protein RIR_jg5973.t1 [Rhizophagus irregularis DAOM 181602=DAOM 197198]